MHARLLALAGTACVLAAAALHAADRDWQQGTWTDVIVTHPRIVIGLKPSPFRPGPDHGRAMTEVRTYVIETRDLRIELKDPVPPSGRPIRVLIGGRVVFALEKKTAYIREPDGSERRMRVSKTRSRLQ